MSKPPIGTTGPKPIASDYEKLMMLALWFDDYDQKRGVTVSNEVQQDLRRIAGRLLSLEQVLGAGAGALR